MCPGHPSSNGHRRNAACSKTVHPPVHGSRYGTILIQTSSCDSTAPSYAPQVGGPQTLVSEPPEFRKTTKIRSMISAGYRHAETALLTTSHLKDLANSRLPSPFAAPLPSAFFCPVLLRGRHPPSAVLHLRVHKPCPFIRNVLYGLINTLTRQVGAGRNFFGYPTYRELMTKVSRSADLLDLYRSAVGQDFGHSLHHFVGVVAHR